MVFEPPHDVRETLEALESGGTMSLFRRTLFASPAALVLLAGSALPALAIPPATRMLFTWSGTVDKEVVIIVRGRDVQSRGAAGLDETYRPRLSLREAMPRQAGQLGVVRESGRGEVEVLQHPSARNDYTALLRIRDPRGGQDNYRLIVSWVDAGNGWDPRDNDRDRDRDRDRDGTWGRGRDDDRGRDGDWDRGRDGDWDRNNGRGRGNGRGRNDDGRLTWRGDVDDVLDIRIQGRRVEYITRSGNRLRNERVDLRGRGLPRRPVDMQLEVNRGRGSVIVVQQPNARNDYTAIVRVVDKRSGYGDYDFDLRWY
jgi:hypothetical protein